MERKIPVGADEYLEKKERRKLYIIGDHELNDTCVYYENAVKEFNPNLRVSQNLTIKKLFMKTEENNNERKKGREC